MSFDNHYPHRKDRRKKYRGAKAVDRSCRNHGSCPYCAKARKYKIKKQEPIEQEIE